MRIDRGKIPESFLEDVQKLGNTNPKIIVKGLKALHGRPHPEILPYLARLLTHPNRVVRLKTMARISDYGELGTIHLGGVIKNSPNWADRRNAVVFLGMIKHGSVEEHLKEAIADRSIAVARSAIIVLENWEKSMAKKPRYF
ncbi:MAG: hypothetical protein AABX01_02700 [Candidatus Micrarchaeota archaeon]